MAPAAKYRKAHPAALLSIENFYSRGESAASAMTICSRNHAAAWLEAAPN